MSFRRVAIGLSEALRPIPRVWDGKSAILEMKRAEYGQWKQMEWIGFYFQFLCERHLAPSMEIPGPKYGNTGFDGLQEIPWDFKAHAMNTSSHHL